MADDHFPTDDSLRKLQAYIWQRNLDRGLNTTDLDKKLVMLIEEVGELAKAVRQSVGLKFTATTKRTELSEELADVLIVLLGLAGIAGVDMHTAVRDKEGKNDRRTWR